MPTKPRHVYIHIMAATDLKIVECEVSEMVGILFLTLGGLNHVAVVKEHGTLPHGRPVASTLVLWNKCTVYVMQDR